MLCQNTGAYFIGGAGGAVSEMHRQQRLLFRQQVALPLAVVYQAEKRQPHTRKSELPSQKNRFKGRCREPRKLSLRHNPRPIALCAGAFPDKRINFASHTNYLKGDALFICQGNLLGDCSCWNNARWENKRM